MKYLNETVENKNRQISQYGKPQGKVRFLNADMGTFVYCA